MPGAHEPAAYTTDPFRSQGEDDLRKAEGLSRDRSRLVRQCTGRRVGQVHDCNH
jgi:hypothetical protein